MTIANDPHLVPPACTTRRETCLEVFRKWTARRQGSASAGSIRRLLALTTALTVSACGGGGGGSSAPEPAVGAVPGADYYPLAVGDRWLYVDGSGAKSTIRVTGTQPVTGGTATVVRTVDSTGTVDDLYLRTTSGVTLLPGASADAITAALGPLQILRLPIAAGDHWVLVDKTLTAIEDLDGDGRADTVVVHAEASVLGFESLATAAGNYTQVAHVQTVLTQVVKLSSNGQSVTVTATSDDWYAPDIGPVRNLSTITGNGTNSRTDTGITGWGLGTVRSEYIAPTVTAKTPDGGSLSGGCCATLTVTFSEAMDASSLDKAGWIITGPGGQGIAGTVQWQADGRTATFVPSSALASGSYAARVTTAAQDQVGNPLAAEVAWQFSVDASGPTVTPVQPLADAVEVPLDTKIVFMLDEDPDPKSIATATIRLSNLSAAQFVDTTVSVSGRTVTVTPLAPLQTAARYQLLVGGIADKFGNPSAAVSWTFSADPGRFAAAEVLIPNGHVTAVAVGDVNGDGRADVLMATGFNFGSADDFKLFVFLRRADGTLAAPQRYATVAGYGAEILSLSVADLDGAGRKAVVAASWGNAIQIFRQQPDGSLASSLTIATPASYVVRVADMDGDGRLDLVGRPFNGGAVQIWLRTAQGSFSPPVAVPVTVGGYGDMAVGDINGDGRNDIVVVSSEAVADQSIAIVLQKADGSYTSPQYRPPPVSGVTYDSILGVAIGDVSGDGRNDVVVSLQFSSSVGVMRQDAQGQLGAITTLRASPDATRVLIADIDGDGRLDVVSSAWGGWPLAINRQRSDGSLGGAETYPVSDYGTNSPGLLAVGDVNGDGLIDIVFGNAWLRQRAVLNTAPPAPTPSAAGVRSRLGLGNLTAPGSR